jgi:hypothetical protein
MDVGLSENLATIKQEFTTAPVDLPPTANIPTGPLDSVDTEESIAEFPAPTPPVITPLHTPITEPLAAETLKGQLSAESAHNIKTMKLSEFISWLSEDGDMDNAIKTLSAEMSLAGFSAPSAQDLTLAAAMWSKKNYQGQSSEETINRLLAESTPVSLRAEIDAFTPFNSEETFSLLSEDNSNSLNHWMAFGGITILASVLAYMVTNNR